MIQISLTAALILYTAFLGFVALAIWIYTELTVRHSYRVLEKQFLWRCVFCGYIYLDEAAEILSHCPRCGSYTSVEDKHARYVETAVNQEETKLDPDRPSRDSSHRKRPHQRRRGPRRR